MLVELTAALVAAPTLAVQTQVATTEIVALPGELIVSVLTPTEVDDFTLILADWNLESVAPGLQLEQVDALLQWQPRNRQDYRNVVHLTFDPESVDQDVFATQLRGLPGVEWVSPHHAYHGDPRELVPNDPQYGAQYHHPLMQNDDAWDITLGDASIVIAITDDGVNLNHEDLAPNIWANPGEIAGDGIDNDANGYVDDINGWDFVSNNNDPNPDGGDHGSHCAGIAAAKTNNGIGVAGTAGDSTIMALQFFIPGQAWTAANVAAAFAYGADNGARIISTSYNMDIWAADMVVFAAFDYIYDQGVLHFNSAGNGFSQNPARQIFEQSLLVINTDAGDVRNGSSNYGDGCDLCAPGTNILSTELGNTYGEKSGTSMSSPNAAGVAALIWAQNPTWTRDQVAAQLVGTADNIDAQNPGAQGMLGGGRANSFRALTDTPDAARITGVTGLPDEGALLIGDLTPFQVWFDKILDPAIVNSGAAVTLTYAGPDDTFGTTDDTPIALMTDEYLISSNRVRASINGSLPFAGTYRVTVDGDALADPFGTLVDGDGDGAPGGDWTRTFMACVGVEQLVDNAETGAGWSVVNHSSLTSGGWTVPPEVPIGGGARSDPPTDYDMSGRCFLTQNGPGDTDVDGGPTRLVSPAFDLTLISDPYLSFALWLGTDNDVVRLHMSDDDGASWTLVDLIGVTDGWEIFDYRVSDTITPNDMVRFRWSVADTGNASITEAGLDFIRILTIDCDPSDIGTSYCTASANSTGMVARVSAEGSLVVSDNDVTLTTIGLPPSTVGYFLVSQTQGFVANPAGSSGNLCLGGMVGRYAGNVLNSGSAGEFSQVVDLNQIPGPLGAVSAMPGETWNFQAWFRDSILGIPTSNFSDGVSLFLF